MQRRRILGALLVLWTAGLWQAAPTLAAGEDVEKQVARMNRKAMEDYDSLEFDSARRTLIDAVAMLRSAGLDETPQAARTYVNLGTVYISGFKDRNRGQQQFVQALKIKPDTKLDPAVATPELEQAFAAAQKIAAKGGGAAAAGGGGAAAGGKPEEGGGGAPEVSGLVHTPVDESRPASPIPVRAQLGSDTGATSLFLLYRGSGQEDFVSQPMKQGKNAEWVGVIPPDAVSGSAIQYYLEARDAHGRAVIGSGSAPNPYIVMVSSSAPPPTGVPDVDVEDPLLRERARRHAEEEEHRPRGKDHVFLFVMPGFGFGFEQKGNHTEVAWQYQVSGVNADFYIPQPVGTGGFTIAPFHIGVELGVFVTQSFTLSAVGRFQIITGGNAETVDRATATQPTIKPTGAIAGMLRARYRFLGGSFHPYLHIDVGGGEIRHALDISSAESLDHPLVDRFSGLAYNNGDRSTVGQEVCKDHKNCVDTIALGLFLAGGGAGLWYDVASHVSLILDVNVLGAFATSGRQGGVNIDVQGGIGTRF